VVPVAGRWITRGFESFNQGSFGNAGQNIYVSRAGVLQRIHQFDVDGDGYLDLVFCNSQNHWEMPPAYVYGDVMGAADRVELPSDGALSGAVADLNGDGYDDLVLAMQYNGTSRLLNAIVYYGSPEGLSERYQLHLPAPGATSVTVGDFNGDGRPDIAFLCEGHLRVFYQSELGFEPKRFVDLDIAAAQLAAEDLDGDGFADLYALGEEGQAWVFWGGPEGIDPARCTEVAGEGTVAEVDSEQSELTSETERIEETRPLAKVIHLGGISHLFVARNDRTLLIPVNAEREFGPPLVIECEGALSAAVGDVNGDGHADLVLATRREYEGDQCSWVYWGSEQGFDTTAPTPLLTSRACDVAVGDLDGDGFDDIIVCQDRTEESFSIHSLVYRGTAEGVAPEPVYLESHGARRVLVARTSDHPLPQVIFVNERARRVGGDVDPTIYHGGADGFSPQRCTRLRGRDAVDAVCCDLNDDGYPDIVTANCAENAVHLDPGSYIFMGSGNGLCYEPNSVLDTTRAHGVCCADLNHDGYLDLVFCGFGFPDILVFYGSAEGFAPDSPQRIRMEIDGVVYDDPRWIYLADLNNDGWLDLVIPQIRYDRSIILWGGPDGFSIQRRQMLSVVNGSFCQAADLTGNGWLDLIIGGHGTAYITSEKNPHDSFVHIYWNGPEGLSEDRRSQLPANAVNGISVADFNNDGHLDLFVCNYHDGQDRDIYSYIYWGQAGGRFSAADRTPLATHSASGCIAADFNEDGWIDLAVANHKTYGDHVGLSWVWWNSPDGFSEEHITTLPTEGPHGMIVVDPGNQRDRNAEEYYISTPFQLPEGAMVRQISWEGELPIKTWVRAQLRFAGTSEDLHNAPWQGLGGDGWLERGEETSGLRQEGRWVQYRLALGAVGGGNTPRVTEVCVSYS